MSDFQFLFGRFSTDLMPIFRQVRCQLSEYSPANLLKYPSSSCHIRPLSSGYPSKRKLTKNFVDILSELSYKWSCEFLEQLKQARKFALRLGTMSDQVNYNLKPPVTKDICAGKRTVESLTEHDFRFNAQQKGVDMKIGVDIASLAHKHQVDQIVLIAGDSDFVPAAKLARREGIDFVLDPMGSDIRDDLFEHIDGIMCPWGKSKAKATQTDVNLINV